MSRSVLSRLMVQLENSSLEEVIYTLTRLSTMGAVSLEEAKLLHDYLKQRFMDRPNNARQKSVGEPGGST